MARAGRKAKSGKREPNGRLSRKGKVVILYDHGTDWARDKQSVYGSDGADAIGRAYVAGLLGEDGLNLRNAARAIFRAYWPMFGVGVEKSCLGDQTGGGSAPEPMDQDERQRKIDRERRLNETLSAVDRMDASRMTRRVFDQLVLDINPDHGPDWLEQLIWAKRHGKTPDIAAVQKLAKAMRALDVVAGNKLPKPIAA